MTEKGAQPLESSVVNDILRMNWKEMRKLGEIMKQCIDTISCFTELDNQDFSDIAREMITPSTPEMSQIATTIDIKDKDLTLLNDVFKAICDTITLFGEYRFASVRV